MHSFKKQSHHTHLMKQVIVGLDIGTTKICTIIGVNSGEEFEIIGIGTNPSIGLKKGSVINIEDTISSIQTSLDQAKLMAGVDIESATIGIAGSHIYSFNSTGAVPIKSKEITQADIDSVIAAAQAVVIPSDRQIIHVIPQEFKVDNTVGIKNPLGMCGVRLEVKVHIVTGSLSLIQNLVKCAEATGIEVEQITLQPLASSNSVLSHEEKEMGVVLVDIGGGTTDIAIWKNGDLVHSSIIPVGGHHFTNDLAVALKTSHSEAERIKVQHGSLLVRRSKEENYIKIEGLKGTHQREVGQSLISEVLKARSEELLTLIEKAIKEVGNTELNGGIVFTGGGSLVEGLAPYCEFQLNIPAKIGTPHSFGGMTNIMRNPQYSTVLGLLIESAKKSESYLKSNKKKSGTEKDFFTRVSNTITNIIKEIF